MNNLLSKMACSFLGDSVTISNLMINPCITEFISAISSVVYIYVFILLFIHLRRAPNIHSGNIQFGKPLSGRNVRYLFILLLLFINIIELQEHLLANFSIWYIKLTPLLSLSCSFICQIFYYKLEKYDKHRYLIVTIAYWTTCGSCKILLFLTFTNLSLNFQFVQYLTSLSTCGLYVCLLICDVISLFKEIRGTKLEKRSNENEKPYPLRNWYSEITFCWLTSILHLSYSKPTSLNSSHVPQTSTTSHQFDQLENLYLKDKHINLWTCFLKIHWKTFVFGGLLKLMGDIVGFIPPRGISVVVKYIETIQSENNAIKADKEDFIKWSEFLSNGYVMAVIVFMASLAQGTLSQNSTHIVNVEGIKLKNVLQGLIYQKLLRICRHTPDLSNAHDNTGYMTNLATEDSYNIMSCFWLGNYIWAIPLKIVLLIYLLYTEIGISAIIGSIFCILMILILQFVIGKKMTNNCKTTTEWSDKRLRRINEVLQGIEFIKLCGWELEFIEEVSKLRNKELKHLNLDSFYWTCITFLANTSSIILAFVTLILYYFVERSQISLSSLFTSIALFNQLTVPLFIFPILIPVLTSAMVSVKRIEALLNMPEIKIPAQIMDDIAFIKFQVNKDKMSTSVKKCDGSLRLQKITENSETDDDAKSKKKDRHRNEIAKINNVVCSWNNPSNLLLKVDEMSIHAGTFNVIIGDKGSGKTSLLLSLLGEMTCISGTIEWKKCLRIGYVPENTWLLNDSIKENILFGFPFQEKHFSRVIQMCALRSDINMMPNKEDTVIGDRGLMVSGGQKKRLMIARMLYSRPDVIIMDNPFNCVDSKTANYIYENMMKKFLMKQNKTMIMTTNCNKFLSEADQIIVMEDMKVKFKGPFKSISKEALDQIRNLNETFESRHTARQIVRDDSGEQSTHRSLKNSTFIPLKRCHSALSGSRYLTHDLLLPTDDCDVSPVTFLPKQRRSRAATVTEYPQSACSLHQNVFRAISLQTSYFSQSGKKKRRFEMEDENVINRHKSTVSDFTDDLEELNEPYPDLFNDANYSCESPSQAVSERVHGFEIYFAYIKYCGVFTVVSYFLLTITWQVLRIFTEYWLSSIVSPFGHSLSGQKGLVWNWVAYVFFSIFALSLSLCSTAVGQFAGSTSRKCIHQEVLKNIIRCPVRFFSLTSFGQIIDRFSADVDIIDKKIPTSSQRLIQFQLICLSAILLNCFITPWFVTLVIPMALIYYKIQVFYRRLSRELQHLENLLKSPITNHFSETLSGLEVIRALQQQKIFLKVLFRRIDAHTNVFLISNATNRWLGIMLDYLGGAIVFAAMLVSLITVSLQPSYKTSTIFGLAINYTLLIPVYLTWVVKFLIDLDIYMGAVDRVQGFSKLPIENYKSKETIPKNWPSRGCIKFENVTLRYSEQGPPVIQNLNLGIKPGQKVGICGRTGSGKSSLMMLMFKMIPYVEGRITLDEVDIDSVPLQYLRSKISIVPQDIILFSGSLRQNLDFKYEFTDEKLWNALKMVKMDEYVSTIGGLDITVLDGGSNFSAGEKQLICIARAILKDSCCLILDEATNSLQPETEIEFFKTIRDIFKESTVVVVTHRVSSLLDFDRVLVMDNGIPVEDGSPQELMEQRNSKFFNLLRMCKELPGETPRFYY